MKQTPLIAKSITLDGVLRSIGVITFEGNKIVHSEHKLLDSKEELERRNKAISARCVFEK